MTVPHPDGRLIVVAPKPMLATVLIAALAGIMPSLQPLLLGAMAAEGRIAVDQIGYVATAEALGMALSVGLAGAFVRPRRLRIIASAVLLVAAALNLLTGQVAGNGLYLARFCCGLCSGLMLWFLVALIAQVSLPARVSAYYVIAQGAGALALASLYASVVLPFAGVQAAYALLAAIAALCIAGAWLMPDDLAPVGAAPGVKKPNGPGAIGLLAATCQLAAIMALWVFVAAIGLAAGLSETTVRGTISIALAAQIAVGMLVARFAALPPARTVVACAAVGIVAATATGMAGSAIAFAVAVTLFSAAWVFVLPYHAPLLIAVDPSRNSVMLLICAQLLGIAGGPFLSALFIGGSTSAAAVPVSIALFLLSSALVWGSVRSASRQAGSIA